MTEMRNLVGVYYAAALVLGAGGVAKIREPLPFVAAMRQLGVPVRRGVARWIGGLEILVAIVVFAVGGAFVAGAVAVVFAGFALVVLAALRADASSCGCFGAASAPPSRVHVAVNLGCAATAAALAIAPVGHLVDVMDDAGSAGPALLALSVVLAALFTGLNTSAGEVLALVRQRRERASS